MDAVACRGLSSNQDLCVGQEGAPDAGTRRPDFKGNTPDAQGQSDKDRQAATGTEKEDIEVRRRGPAPVRKVRSKNYSCIIEINAPMRFHWSGDRCDGYSLRVACSPYQRRLMRKITDLLAFQADCARIVEYLESSHREEWAGILDMVAREVEVPIPKAFLDAFSEKGG